MKIGVFDSGLGGLIILKAIHEVLPQYDFVYLGDTKRLPYGKLTQEKIYKYTAEAMDYLFSQDCQLIVIACNTVSTRALRRIQREYLPYFFPERRVLGVVVPTVEAICDSLMSGGEADGALKVGVLATKATVRSKAYIREFNKVEPNLIILQRAATRLVRLIEERAETRANAALRSATQPLLEEGVNAIVLGCTHYCLVKEALRDYINPEIKVVSQDEVIPHKLVDYLKRHPEIDSLLSKATQHSLGQLDLRVTKLTASYEQLAGEWFGSGYTLKEVNLT